MILRSLAFGVLCVLSGLLAFGQRTFSVSGGLGTSYYYGDLTDGFTNSLVRPAISISGNYYVTPTLSFRAGITAGAFGAADSMSGDEGRQVRDLHFRSPIGEVSGVLMYEFIRDKYFGIPWQRRKKAFSPYAFGGIALFAFNPRAQLDGRWYALQPLGTEGQFIPDGDYPDPYSRVSVALPFGGGVSVRITPEIGLNFEIGYRMTFTDYLDDVSTNYPDFDALRQTNGPVAVDLSASPHFSTRPGAKRGNPGVDDSYFFTMVSATYYFSRYALRGN